MSPELAVKIQLLTQIPEFREDLEKTASVLNLNGDQVQEVILRTAAALDLGRIEKQAAPWYTTVGGGLASLLAAALAGEQIHKTWGVNQGDVDAARKAGEAAGAAASIPGTTIGGLGGGALGAILGNTLSDGGTLGTGVGAGLGGIGGSLLGNYIGTKMGKQ
jgi:hypothetical protein